MLHLCRVFTAHADHNGLSPRQIKSDSDDDDLPNVTLDSVNETGSTALSIARAVQEWVSRSIQPSDYRPCQCTTVLGAKHNTSTKCKKGQSWCSGKTIAVQGAGRRINFSRTQTALSNRSIWHIPPKNHGNRCATAGLMGIVMIINYVSGDQNISKKASKHRFWIRWMFKFSVQLKETLAMRFWKTLVTDCKSVPVHTSHN